MVVRTSNPDYSIVRLETLCFSVPKAKVRVDGMYDDVFSLHSRTT
jgi:hypothetical protein